MILDRHGEACEIGGLDKFIELSRVRHALFGNPKIQQAVADAADFTGH